MHALRGEGAQNIPKYWKESYNVAELRAVVGNTGSEQDGTEQNGLLGAPVPPSLFEASVDSCFVPLGVGVIFQQV